MSDLKIIRGEFASSMPLLYASNIKAGFPSPADDYLHDTLDFHRDFIRHPEATYYGRIAGDSMADLGLDEGDIAVIDRAVEPRDGDIVVAAVDGEFTIKQLDLSHQHEGYVLLQPANKKYQPIRVDNNNTLQLFGVVLYTIKAWR